MDMRIESFHKQIRSYIFYLENVKGLAKHTLRNYQVDLVMFYRFLVKKKEPLYNKSSLRNYLLYLHLQKMAKKTVARRLSTIKDYSRFLYKKKMLDRDFTQDIEHPKVEKRVPMILTVEEVKRLLDEPDTKTLMGVRDKTILEVLYSSGLRVEELVNLSRESLFLKEGIVRVVGKGSYERLLPLTSEAVNWLKIYLNHPERFQNSKKHKKECDHKAIFLNKWGKRLTVRSVARLFKFYKKKTSIAKNITPHTLRHSVATHWLENGMNVKMIQELLGHKSLSTTTIYTSVSQGLKTTVYANTHPLEVNE